MHIGVADHNGEHKAADKLRDGGLTAPLPKAGVSIGNI